MERNMGLDMYAFTTGADIPAVDFKQPDDSAELFYWRKHPNLHGWMEELYRAKGGSEDDFNCVPVRLEKADIDALETIVNGDNLPFTTGFFFGESLPEDKNDDLNFVQKARAALNEGKRVYYTSWW
jgi:hypothetical protein